MCVCAKSVQSCPAHQAPLSMGFSRQEPWSGVPCPPRGDLPHPGIESLSLVSPAQAVGSLLLGPPGKPHLIICVCIYIHIYMFN